MNNIFEKPAQHSVTCFCNKKLSYFGFAMPPHKKSDTFGDFVNEIENRGWTVKNKLRSDVSPFTVHCPECEDYTP